MKSSPQRRQQIWQLCLLILCCLSTALAQTGTKADGVAVVTVHDTMQPVRARSFARQIAAANDTGASVVLVNLSTPGGMSSAVDIMVDAIRQSRIPVVVWTGISYSRVGGQGLRLLAAADAAFMSKETYLSPLWANPPRGLTPEQRNSGSLQLLAQLSAEAGYHHRDTSALDELASGVHWFYPAEALRAGLIDGTSDAVSDIIRQINGRTIYRGSKTSKIILGSTQLHYIASDNENFLLLSLMNPNLDVLLLTLGLLLIYLEINTPGIVVPGATGLLLVLLTVFALGWLPISLLGLSLCVLALILLVLESRLHTRGILAIIGSIALVIGLGTLVDGPIPQLQVAWTTALGAGVGFGGVTAALMALAGEARRAKVKTGADAMLGWLAVAQTPLSPAGRILVRGELWNARLTSNDTSVAAGERVKVLRADGLTLEVTAVPLPQSS